MPNPDEHGQHDGIEEFVLKLINKHQEEYEHKIGAKHETFMFEIWKFVLQPISTNSSNQIPNEEELPHQQQPMVQNAPQGSLIPQQVHGASVGPNCAMNPII